MADLLLDEHDGPALWQLLGGATTPGPAARVYVCGNIGFAASVAEAVRALVRSHVDAPPHPTRVLAWCGSSSPKAVT